MEYLTIELKCSDTHCLKCQLFNGEWFVCQQFDNQTPEWDEEKAEYFRLSECIAACKEQKEFFKSNGIVEIDIRTPHTS